MRKHRCRRMLSVFVCVCVGEVHIRGFTRPRAAKRPKERRAPSIIIITRTTIQKEEEKKMH
jgi:hypothetical protein